MGQWFYAFTLPPQTPSAPVPARPANATANPFLPIPIAKKRGLDEDDVNGQSQKKGRLGMYLKSLYHTRTVLMLHPRRRCTSSS